MFGTKSQKNGFFDTFPYGLLSKKWDGRTEWSGLGYPIECYDYKITSGAEKLVTN